MAILVIAYSYLCHHDAAGTPGSCKSTRSWRNFRRVGRALATTQRRVLLPLIVPALTAGFILLFIIGVREFTLPLVLYSQENVVLSVLLWQLFQNGQPAPSAALGTIMIAVVLPVILLTRRILGARGAD